MTADIIKICSGALIAAVCGFLLRELGWRGAAVFSVLSIAVFLGLVADGLQTVTGGVFTLAERTGVGEIAKEILKVLGASYVFGICSDVCGELGERGLASLLTVVGRVEILLIAAPYFVKVTESAVMLVG